jgi:2-dehydropantoate 2-reductase
LRPILRRQVSGARGDKLPSLYIDLHQGKLKSEIGWLNGAIAERGKAIGVATPVNAVLTKTITALIGNPQLQAEWKNNVERLAAACK